MAKLDFDKYYTPRDLARYCYNTALRVIGEENITEIIEPSAGDGAFMDCNPAICGYDLVPGRSDIIQADFLELDLNYCEGRLFIGNPPFGSRMSLATKFFKHCVQLGDYIAFILPISQLNNTNMLYEFDLIHSEDLGEREYSGIKLRCVFNVYRRPKKGPLNRKPVHKFPGITICRNDSKGYATFPYDIRMCAWGNATAGKILTKGETYSAEYKIAVSEVGLPKGISKAEILAYINTFDWNSYVTGVAMKKIQQHHIVTVLKEKFYRT